METEKFSKKTFLAIREARFIQYSASELFKLQNTDPEPKINQVSLDDDSEMIAEIEKGKLNIGFEEKNLNGTIVKKQINKLYNNLKEKIESFNIFVIQANKPINEVRGFTLTDKFPRIILINSADSIKPRIFTLLHEYAHILLKKDGICLPNSENFTKKSKDEIQKIEKWCNAFAGSFLMPKNEFLNQVSLNEESFNDPKKVIINLSRKFRVSHKAVIVRILNLKENSFPYKQMYLKYYNKIILEPIIPPKTKKGGGAPHPIDKCISKKGRKFVNLVSNSHEKKFINSNEMVSYLNLKIKHFDKLHTKL